MDIPLDIQEWTVYQRMARRIQDFWCKKGRKLKLADRSTDSWGMGDTHKITGRQETEGITEVREQSK